MTRKTKLWGGLVFCHPPHFDEDCRQQQHRCLVQATSQKRAIALMDSMFPGTTPLSYFRDYWSVTGNDVEVALGASVEGEALWIVKGARNAFANNDPEQYTRLV